MDVHELTRPDRGVATAFGESRSRVLEVLQDAAGPLGVRDVAGRVRLHPNTTRFHLDALVEAGVAERTVEDRERPGRPRTLYMARPDSPRSGRRSYRLLAEILTSYIDGETPQPGKAAQRAGQAWGRYLADRPPPFQRVDGPTATRQLVRTLGDIGFDPESVTDGGEQRILLHHCPFRETAEEHRKVVCSIHLGLMQGLLAELDAPVEADRLDPFVEPDLCVAHLAAKDGVEPTEPRRRSDADGHLGLRS